MIQIDKKKTFSKSNRGDLAVLVRKHLHLLIKHDEYAYEKC